MTKKQREEQTKKVRAAGSSDSLHHMYNEKTGYYDLKSPKPFKANPLGKALDKKIK